MYTICTRTFWRISPQTPLQIQANAIKPERVKDHGLGKLSTYPMTFRARDERHTVGFKLCVLPADHLISAIEGGNISRAG